MTTIAIASGKGGTGKTTVAMNLALSIKDNQVQLLDCDVEEPNAHLFLKPHFTEETTVGIPVPEIDYSRCTFCGRCAEVCSFNALAVLKDQVMVLAELCHGCGSCAYLCPEQAITEVDRLIGVIQTGTVAGLEFGHGCLNPGEAMSPPLINALKKKVNADKLVIIDAPPGTSCPVVSAVSNADFCVLVTEPTPFGLNDLELAYRMVQRLNIPAGVVINRADYGDAAVENFCAQNNIPLLQKIPFDLEMARLYARGEVAVQHLPRWQNIFDDLILTIDTLRQKEG